MTQRPIRLLPVSLAFAAGLACTAVAALDAYVAGAVSARVVYSATIAFALLLTAAIGLCRQRIFWPILANVLLLALGLLGLQLLVVPSRHVDGSKAYEIWRLGGPDAGVYPDAGPYNFLEAEVGVDDLSSRLPEIDGRQIIPLGGPAHARLVVCNEDDGWFSFDSDRYGFNNPDSIHERIAVERPIVIIGDSFVEGACTPDHFVGRLQRSLTVPVVNLGKGGNGPLAELATLQEFGLPMRPRTVVWVYFAGNDLAQPWSSPRRPDLARELRSPLLRSYLKDGNFSQQLGTHIAVVDASLKAILDPLIRARRELPSPLDLFRQVGHVAISQGLALYTLDLITGGRPKAMSATTIGRGETDSLLTTFDNIMRRVRGMADDEHFDVIFVLLPDKASCTTHRPHELDPEVRRIALDLHFRIVDLFQSFGGQECDEGLFAAGGPHLTSAGNKVVAAALVAALQ